MAPLSLDPNTTALVVIDLQQGIVRMSTAPHTAPQVIANAARLADAFRAAAGTVVLVRVAFAADGRDRVRTPTEAGPPASPPSSDWSDLVPPMGPKPGDLVVTKRQWGAFYGTELDLHLRRRGIRAIVLAGISTNFGVESTARDAYERSFELVFAEDAMASGSGEMHTFAVTAIFPRLGLIRSTAEIVSALGRT